MVKIYYIGIIKNDSIPGHELVAEKNLGDYGYFAKSSVGEFMTLFSKTVAERTKPGQRQDVQEGEYVIRAYGRSEGVCGIIISDDTYPRVAAHTVLSKVVDEFLVINPRSSFANSNPTLPFPELKGYIVKFQDPKNVSDIAEVHRALNDATKSVHNTIEALLQRGDKIDDLVAKSEGLSAQSKMFYNQAKKQNSCCVVM